MRRSVSLVAALLMAAGCSSSTTPDAPTKSVSSRIVNGKASPSPSSQDAAVLVVHTDKTSYFGACTGTLLASNLVLTARHCVSDTVEAGFGCDEKGNLIGGSTGGTVGADFKPSDIYIFTGNQRPNFDSRNITANARGATIIHDSSKVLCSHDIALILLDTQIEGAQIAPIRLDDSAKVGETFTAVGWGVTTTDAFPSTRQQRTGLKIDTVGPAAGPPPVSPNNFEVGESICQGDSGGPAFVDGTGAVIGVVSRGGNGQNSTQQDPSAGCVGTYTINDYTQTSPFKDMILDAYDQAGAEPWLEGQPDPRLAKLGEACGSNDDCRSAACLEGKCSQFCGAADDPPCPDQYTCTAVDGDHMCKPNPPERKGGCAIETSEHTAAGDAWLLVFAAAAVLTVSRRSRSRSHRDRNRSS